MDNDDVTSSTLAPSLKQQLKQRGLQSKAKLQGIRVNLLMKELRISAEEAAAVKRKIDAAFGWGPVSGPESYAAAGHTALELLERRPTVSSVVTFCKDMDTLLGGGVQLGEVTEFCEAMVLQRGVPGVGKTQLCMQLALDVQIPAELGGMCGEALYIDTEGSMMANRLEQMAIALHRHLAAVAKRTAGAGSALASTVEARCTPAALMTRIHLMRCKELGEQIATFAALPGFLAKHPAVRIVILDSVTFHFRYAEADVGSSVGSRARMLQSLSQTLHRCAASYNVAVVVINQMTTRIRDGSGGGNGWVDGNDGGTSSSRLVPALGESWAHACTNRVILRWDGLVRVAQLVKSPSRPGGEVRYSVTIEGVRGFRAPQPTSLAPSEPTAASLVHVATDTDQGDMSSAREIARRPSAAIARSGTTALGKRDAATAGLVMEQTTAGTR